jgi:hypothetical protein
LASPSGELGAGTGGGDSGITIDTGSPDGLANNDAAANEGAAAEASQGEADAATDAGRDEGGEDADCIQPPTPLATGSTLSPFSSSFPPPNWVAYSNPLTTQSRGCVAYPLTTSRTTLLLAISIDSTVTTLFTNTTNKGYVTLVVTSLEESGGPIFVSVRTVCPDAQTEIGKTRALLALPGGSPIPMYGLNAATYYVVVSNIPFANRYALSTQ